MTEHTTDIEGRLRALISRGETSEVEFKSARGGFSRQFLGKLLGFRQHRRRHDRAWCGGEEQPFLL